MRLAADFFDGMPQSPKMTLGGIAEDDTAENPETTRPPSPDAELWRRQQEVLRKHRLQLAELVARKRKGADCERDIKTVYRMIAGRHHVSTWDDLWPAIVGLAWLDPSFHRGAFVFGGWFVKTKAAVAVRPAPGELIEKLRSYAYYQMGEDLVIRADRSYIAPAEQEKARTELLHHLNRRPWEFALDAIDDLKGLSAYFRNKLTELPALIEDQLLFLQHRVFIFSPTADDPTAGWREFYQFTRCYKRVVDNLPEAFGPYHWRVLLPKAN